MKARLFAATGLISFTGSLPVGTLNAGVSALVITGDIRGAIWFGLGAILVEAGLVRAALELMRFVGRDRSETNRAGRDRAGRDREKKYPAKRDQAKSDQAKSDRSETNRPFADLRRWTPWLRMLACAVIFSLAYINLSAAWHRQAVVPGLSLTGGRAPFISGLLLSLLNPLHLPYWMGWTAVLRSRGLLAFRTRDYNVFVLAIGVGTALAFGVYGVTGHLLIPYLQTHGYVFNWAVGIALLVAGIRIVIPALAIIKNPASAER